MSCPYNVFYNNSTGRVVIRKNMSPPRYRSPPKEFDKKIEELYKFTNINSPNKVSIEKNNKISDIKTIDIDKIINEQIYTDKNDNNKSNDNIKNTYNHQDNKYDYKKEYQYNSQYNNQHNNEEEYEYNNQYDNKKYNMNNNQQYNDQSINTNLKSNKDINITENTNSNIISKTDTSSNTDTSLNSNIDTSLNSNSNIYSNVNITNKSLIYGIKKTILSDFNHLYESSNANDFKISLNKNITMNNKIFDCFYLFPNISEINTKSETNIINEKKIEIFCNNNDQNDLQYFPIDFVACGINIPLVSHNKYYSKIRINNIFWNIFQSINSCNYKLNEILCIVPNKDDFLYKNINLQVNFELHSQIISDELPYKNNKLKNITPANTCLYKIPYILISNLNGSNFHFLEIDLNQNIKLECALLCVKISVPCSHMNILEGVDKNNRTVYGNIPFSQFILNFDYELL